MLTFAKKKRFAKSRNNSVTPPKDHPVNTVTLLLRPLYFGQEKKALSLTFLFTEPL